MKNSGIGLVVIGFASQEVWPTFFESLAASSVVPEAVVVVENSAVPPKGLADLYVPGVTLIHLPENPGYGSGANAGVAALPAHCSRVIICNPDIIWQRESIAELDKALNDNPTVGVAGPKTLNDDGSTYPSARAFPGIRIGIGHALLGELWKSNPWTTKYLGEYGGSAPRIVDWVSGACLMVKRVSFEAIDGFDSGYFMFFEDVDFGWRARVAGHSVIVASDAVGYHAQAAASERRTVDVKGALLHRPLLLDRRNAAYVLLANASMWALPMLSLQLLAGALFRSVGYLIAKLPGYASDEILAILTLIIHPTELLAARRARKKSRFISGAAVKAFIPSRFQQIRSSVARAIDALRESVIPDREETVVNSALEINEDESINLNLNNYVEDLDGDDEEEDIIVDDDDDELKIDFDKPVDENACNLNFVTWTSRINQVVQNIDFFLSWDTAWLNCSWRFLNCPLLVIPVNALLVF